MLSACISKQHLCQVPTNLETGEFGSSGKSLGIPSVVRENDVYHQSCATAVVKSWHIQDVYKSKWRGKEPTENYLKCSCCTRDGQGMFPVIVEIEWEMSCVHGADEVWNVSGISADVSQLQRYLQCNLCSLDRFMCLLGSNLSAVYNTGLFADSGKSNGRECCTAGVVLTGQTARYVDRSVISLVFKKSRFTNSTICSSTVFMPPRPPQATVGAVLFSPCSWYCPIVFPDACYFCSLYKKSRFTNSAICSSAVFMPPHPPQATVGAVLFSPCSWYCLLFVLMSVLCQHQSSWCYIYLDKFFVTFFTSLFNDLSLTGLTWLTNHSDP